MVNILKTHIKNAISSKNLDWSVWCTFEDFQIKAWMYPLNGCFLEGGGGGGEKVQNYMTIFLSRIDTPRPPIVVSHNSHLRGRFVQFQASYLVRWWRYSRHLVFSLTRRFHGTQLYHCRILSVKLPGSRKYAFVPKVALTDFMSWAFSWEIVIYIIICIDFLFYIFIRFEISWLYI